MKQRIILWMVLVASLGAGDELVAAEQATTAASDRTELSLTVYNNDLTMVRDVRRVHLEKGETELAVEDVSGRLRPESLNVIASTDNGRLEVVERRFHFDLVTADSLARYFVGKEVAAVRTNPATGEDSSVTATIVGIDGGPVLRVGEGIEAAFPGRIVYPFLPDSLAERPALSLTMTSDSRQASLLDIRYLTSGLSWQADYVFDLAAEGNSAAVDVWATVTNTSQANYQGARLALVAGEVNQVQAMKSSGGPMLMEARAMAADTFQGVAEEGFADGHLYTIARPLVLADRETMQLPLFRAAKAVCERVYVFRNSEHVYLSSMRDEAVPRQAEVLLRLVNTKESGLGLPLPEGVARVYGADSNGVPRFAGEDRMRHVPVDGDIELHLADSFDVRAIRTQTEFDRIKSGSRQQSVYEAAFQTEVSNSLDRPATVEIVEAIPGDWEMLSESRGHVKKNAGQVVWKMTVPANGKEFLGWRVRVTM